VSLPTAAGGPNFSTSLFPPSSVLISLTGGRIAEDDACRPCTFLDAVRCTSAYLGSKCAL
jgi:hypothetical protein